VSHWPPGAGGLLPLGVSAADVAAVAGLIVHRGPRLPPVEVGSSFAGRALRLESLTL
jgi:hypothetical protein